MAEELNNWEIFGVLVAVGFVLFIAGFLILALVLYIQRTWLGGKCSNSLMHDKVVLITGANSGIGKETALELARRGARVIMACRTMSTAEAARDEIITITGNKDVEVRPLDLGSQHSVRQFCAKLIQTEARIDVLIHNAACANVFHKSTSPEGLELTMATNHFGPFLMTHLLIDLLKRSAPCRIVVVASKAYKFASLDLDNLNPVDKLPAYLYALSKYANIVFAMELSRRLEGTGVSVNCLHPGTIDTGIWRNVPFPLNLPLKVMIACFFKNVTQGAQTTIHVAAAHELEGINGKYFRDCKEDKLLPNAVNPETGRKLWMKCCEFVSIGPQDPVI